MSDELNWLITILAAGDVLLRVAVKIDKWDLPSGRILDITNCPMEPENRKAIHALLPDHVRAFGPIVAVEEIFDVCVSKGGGG